MESKQFAAFDEELFHLLTEHFGDKWSYVWDAEEGGFYLRLTVHSQPKMWADDDDDNFIKEENMEEVIAKSHEWFAEIKDRTDDEQYCCGFEIGDQIIDINIYDGEKICEDNKWHCEVIECFDDENGCHARGNRYQHLWSIDKKG
jgi:hypothetical protein